MVDCGEGTQHQLKRYRVKSSKIDHIFISHLHGDHYLGIMGLISTFHLNNRTTPLVIFGPKGLDEMITLHLKYSNTHLSYPIRFVATSPHGKNMLLDLGDITIYSFPLRHRIPCTGFSFEEKSRRQKLNKERIEATNPSIEEIQTLVQGKDVLDEFGNLKYAAVDFLNEPSLPRKYAFCSDTVYDPNMIPYIEGVDLLYHEATFMTEESERAKLTMHSTAEEAAKIAKAAAVGQLLLGHYSVRYIDLYPLLWEARDIFEPTLLSEEGKTYLIK